MLGLSRRPRSARSGRLHAAGARLRRPPRRSGAGPARRRRRDRDRARRIRDVQRMVEQVLAILAKLGLQARVLPLPRLADARSPGAARAAARCRGRPRRLPAHAAAATTARRCARASRSATSSPAVDHLTALRARGTYLQRTLDETFKDIDIAILPILADPLPTIAELDVGGGPQAAGGDGARRQVHAAHQLSGPADADAARAARRRPAERHPARSAGRSRRPSCSPSAKPTSARCRRRSRGRSPDLSVRELSFRDGVLDACPPVRLLHLLQ